MKASLVAALAGALACSGCGQDGSMVRAYATAHAKELVIATRPLWTAGKDSGAEIPVGEWPATVRALGPARVVVVRDGVFIYIDTGYADLTAVFVRHSPDFSAPDPRPPDSDSPSFDLLAQDVYRYTIPR